MNALPRPAPEWQVDQWFNTSTPLSLAALKGKAIVLEAFQMLCPGCVSHGLPQAQRIAATFGRDKVAVVGLHTVFEHHAAMTPVSLQAFLHEYRINFPVGVDRPGQRADIPQTMSAYGMRGTPTLCLIDAQGVLRFQHFGQVSDLLIGAQIAELVIEAQSINTGALAQIETATPACDENGCAVPHTDSLNT